MDFVAAVAELDQEIADLQEQLARARSVREWMMERAARNVSGEPVLNGAAAPPRLPTPRETESGQSYRILVQTKKPPLKNYIARVLESSGSLTVREITDRAVGVGWETDSPNKGPMVRNTLRRMVETGEVEPEGNRFRLTDPEETPSLL
jgi:hypothetical protein